MDDDSLLARQTALQHEAVEFGRELGLEEMLARVGRAYPLGSSVTGLMVWRDLDYGVDAIGLTRDVAFATMLPLLARSRTALYEDDSTLDRHYFVVRIAAGGGSEWKLDVSFFRAGIPAGVLEFQHSLPARLTDQTRLAILRLKDSWHREATYPEPVGAYEIYEAVLDHGVRTLPELDGYLRARGLPTRSA